MLELQCAQTVTQPFIQFPKFLGRLRQMEIGLPAGQVFPQLFRDFVQAATARPARHMPDALPEGLYCLGGYSSLYFTSGCYPETIAEKLPAINACYVVQFGIGNDKEVNFFWDKRPVADEPVKTGNLKGTISYARDGIASRTTQLFINLKDNYKLDTIDYNGLCGFTPVAKIISGFGVIESLFAGYGFEPANHQDSVMIYGNAYWKKKFPELDYIIEATITGE